MGCLGKPLGNEGLGKLHTVTFAKLPLVSMFSIRRCPCLVGTLNDRIMHMEVFHDEEEIPPLQSRVQATCVETSQILFPEHTAKGAEGLLLIPRPLTVFKRGLPRISNAVTSYSRW